MGTYAFENCQALEKVIIGSGLTRIENNAFSNCFSLTDVLFGNNITSIGSYAFCNAPLNNVVIDGNIEIASWSFNSCRTLILEENVQSLSVTLLHNTPIVVFKGDAPSLINRSYSPEDAFNRVVLYPSGNQTYTSNYKSNLNYRTRGGYSNTWYAYDSNLITSDSIIGSCGTNCIWALTGDTLYITGVGAMRNFSGRTAVPWYEYRDQITRIVVEDGITSLGNYQFMGCENVTEVYLSNTLTFIGVNAFSTCKSLTTITIPATVRTINGYAFHKCAALTEVTFEGDRPQALAPTAFANTGVVID